MKKIPLVSTVLASIVVAACSAAPTSSEPGLGEQSAALDIVIGAPVAGIPVTGAAHAQFQAVDDAIRRFMTERCVGGAVVGVAHEGHILHNRGYGYKDGPPSAACATSKDPFVGGAKIQPDTPFRIGSNSKAVTAAVLRIELKKALSHVRGAPVDDADIEALKLLDNGEIELVAPSVRAAMLAGGDLGGITTDPCAVVNPWPKVTIGQLLTHRSGLPRSGEDAYEELSNIRGITSGASAAAQEAASGAPNAAKTALKADRGNNAYFVKAATIEDYATAQGNRCFLNEPGTTTHYSNSGFGILGYVLEHITGRAFNAVNGYPLTHGSSLLADFTQTELGFGTGIALSQTALGKRDPLEPRYRHFSSTTYYPDEKDEKRPWCILSGGHCDFAQYTSGTSRFDWAWNEQRVPFTYGAETVFGGVGLLAASAPRYLAFMKRFAVSTPYGKDRALFAQTSDKGHTGALGGTASYVAELVDGNLGYKSFGNNPDGTMSFDLSAATNGSCSLPPGIDLFFAMNQSKDAKCTEANDCIVCEDAECEDKKSAYSLYVEVLREALCHVDWAHVDLDPPVFVPLPIGR